MKTIKQGVITVGALLLVASAVNTFAIEGLQIAVKCRDVILSWPSDEFSGETYIVQYRADLTSTNPWTTLTNYMPPDAGTNLTFFVHSNIVQHPNCGVSGSGSMMALNTSGSFSRSPESLALRSAARAARMAQLSNDLALLIPPAMPAIRPKRLLKSLSSATPESSSGGISVSGAGSPQTPDPAGGNPPGGGADFVPETGFYRVVRNNIHLFGVTNKGTSGNPVF